MILFAATRNAHKTQEIRDILSDSNVRVFTMADFPAAPVVVEDGATFQENALKKAVHFSKWINSNPRLLSLEVKQASEPMYALADDSGLEVDALNGAPGVHSARFAAMDIGSPGNSPDIANNSKLLRLLKDVPQEKRSARFRCVLALTPVGGNDPVKRATYAVGDYLERHSQLFEGICEGRILAAASGHRGFGYDPLFVPEGYHETFGDLTEDVKNRISHRAQAMAKLKTYLESKHG